ncbi:MAG: hypothetical protein MPN21_10065 [Thermoanaerobaculia bacterium]|nr:hypothetical protein [Thermoanaerobaculia bacterium]
MDTMSLDVFRLLFDFGLVILIWLVQLIIYPSFRYIDRAKLGHWHARYTVLISSVVVPLMLGQALVVGLQVWQRGGALDWMSAALLGLVWLVTFSRAVPLHDRIARHAEPDSHLEALVRWNWARTVLWTVIFIAGWWSAGGR